MKQQRKDVTYTPMTEIHMQLKRMNVLQLNNLSTSLVALFGASAEISLSADWDGIAWLVITFVMSEDEWKASGLVNRLYVLEKEYIEHKIIRHFEHITGKHEEVKQ